MTKRIPLGLLALLVASPLAAQEQDERASWSVLRLSKWATLTATTAAAVYGVTTIRGADDSYERLELACQADPQVCRLRRADGSYNNAELEQQYQSVRRQDRRARNALLASQIGVAATVVLFIIDLRHARSPDDIPYQPRGLEVVPLGEGGVGVGMRVSLW